MSGKRPRFTVDGVELEEGDPIYLVLPEDATTGLWCSPFAVADPEDDGRPEGCICGVDGLHIVWDTECPVHWEFAQHIAREAHRRAGLGENQP